MDKYLPKEKPIIQHYDDGDNGFDTGYNYALKEVKATLSKLKMSEEKVEKIIRSTCNDTMDCDYNNLAHQICTNWKDLLEKGE